MSTTAFALLLAAMAQDTVRISVDSSGNEGDDHSGATWGMVATSGSQPLNVLTCSGGSCESGRWSIAIADGVGLAAGHLGVGIGHTNGIQIFGGTFHPDFAQLLFPTPVLLGGPVGVGGAGSLFIDGANIGSVGHSSIFLQCTFLDSRAPKGISLSNALEIAIDA